MKKLLVNRTMTSSMLCGAVFFVRILFCSKMQTKTTAPQSIDDVIDLLTKVLRQVCEKVTHFVNETALISQKSD